MLNSGNGLQFLECSSDIIDAFLSSRSLQFDRNTHRPIELRIVCSRSLKHPQLSHFAEDESPTLLVGILADSVTLGPLQMLRRSVCLTCLQHWAAVADWGEPELPVPLPAETKLIELAVQLTSEALQEFVLSGSVPSLENSLTLVDAETGNITRHPVFPRANCSTCANVRDRKSLTLRVHCSPLTGIVKHLKCSTQPVAGVFHARCIFTTPLSSPRVPRHLGTAWGRGISVRQAEDSCIGEALESYSATYRGDEPTIRASLADLHQAIDPQAILLYSPAQYETREHRNKVLPERHVVPEPLDRTQPIDWVPGTDLLDGELRWVPAASCFLSYPFREQERKFTVASRAGCASGICYTDALAGALLELIEHDAVAIWWYNQIQRPAVQLESLASPALLLIRDALQKLNRNLLLLDITTDVRIPAYVAVSAASGGTQLLFGAAAHPSPRTAAELAASEVSQRWLCSHIARMPSDFLPWIYKASLSNQLHCNPLSEREAPPEPAALAKDDIVQLCIQRLNAIGIRPVSVDLSRPDVVLHTVRVVAPGLRSVYDRRAPGRLYDVPVKLGWLHATRSEAQLNPLSCVF